MVVAFWIGEIEKLRQKREEYGVTQTRIAVACGISREYYSRIEKGKRPLNDELKEVIEKQIERFNPREPLFLLIDYFHVCFPTTDALAIIRDVLQLKGKGCRQMECYLLAQEHSWYDFMWDCMTAGDVMKRLDLAINGREGYWIFQS